MAVSAKLFLVFCYLDSKRISEELLKGAAHPILKMDADGNEQETVAEDDGVVPDLVDLMMDDDEFDATIERMVSLSLVREYTEPDQPEQVEEYMEDYFQRSSTTKGRNPNDPDQKGRFNAALGDLRNFRASIRQRL